MAQPSSRLNVTLSEESAAKLARLAEQTHVREGTLASSLLAQAIDDADPAAGNLVEILDGIAGSWERIDAGLAQARAGDTVPFGSE